MQIFGFFLATVKRYRRTVPITRRFPKTLRESEAEKYYQILDSVS